MSDEIINSKETSRVKTKRTKRMALLFPILIAVISVILYHDCLRLGFLSEDVFTITHLIHKNTFTDIRIRPVLNGIFRTNYELFGGNPRSFHLLNLLFHTAAGMVLFGVIMLITNRNALLSFVVATLFTVHPVVVKAVFWLSALEDPLCGFLYFISILFFLLYLRTGRIIYYINCFISFGLCLLSKEPAVSLPFVMLLMWFVIDYSQKESTYFKNHSLFEKLKHYTTKLWPFFFLILVYLFAVFFLRSSARAWVGSKASIFGTLISLFKSTVFLFMPSVEPLLSTFFGKHLIFIKVFIALFVILTSIAAVLLIKRKRWNLIVEIFLGALFIIFPLLPVLIGASSVAHVDARHMYIPLGVLLIYITFLIEKYRIIRKKAFTFFFIPFILLFSFLSHRDVSDFLKGSTIARTFLADVRQLVPEPKEKELLFLLTIPEAYNKVSVLGAGVAHTLCYNFTDQSEDFFNRTDAFMLNQKELFWASKVVFRTDQFERGIGYDFRRSIPEIVVSSLLPEVYFHLPDEFVHDANAEKNKQYETEFAVIKVLEVETLGGMRVRNRIKKFVVSLKNIENYNKIYLLKYENGHVMLMDTIEKNHKIAVKAL